MPPGLCCTTQFSPKCTLATGSAMSRSVAKYLLQARNSYRSMDMSGTWCIRKFRVTISDRVLSHKGTITLRFSFGVPSEFLRKRPKEDFIILPCTSLGTHSHKWLQEDHFVASICEHKSLLILGRGALTRWHSTLRWNELVGSWILGSLVSSSINICSYVKIYLIASRVTARHGYFCIYVPVRARTSLVNCCVELWRFVF